MRARAPPHRTLNKHARAPFPCVSGEEHARRRVSGGGRGALFPVRARHAAPPRRAGPGQGPVTPPYRSAPRLRHAAISCPTSSRRCSLLCCIPHPTPPYLHHALTPMRASPAHSHLRTARRPAPASPGSSLRAAATTPPRGLSWPILGRRPYPGRRAPARLRARNAPRQASQTPAVSRLGGAQ